MLALRFEKYGLENLHLEEVPTPVPQPEEVLVKVQAASINPSDVKNVLGKMSQRTVLPRTPGRDFAGMVVEGPPNLVGVEVWGAGGDLGFTRDGTHAEYLTLPSNAVVCRPKKLAPEQAASAGVNVVTAWSALFDRGQLKKHETLLIIGAEGGVGRAAVELGGWAGARVIGVDRYESHQSRADVFLDSSSETFAEELKAAIGDGVDVAFDTVSGPMFEIGLQSLKPSGRLICITVQGDPHVSLDLLRFYRDDLSLLGLNTLNIDTAASAVILQEVARPYDLGWLTPREIEIHPLSEALEAYEKALRGGIKQVLVMG
jgi:NADPH2:quinone reductase